MILLHRKNSSSGIIHEKLIKTNFNDNERIPELLKFTDSRDLEMKTLSHDGESL